MKRSFSLAQVAVGSWQFSARQQCGPSLFPSRHSPLATRCSARGACRAFTLIELLVVVAIIAILAGLTLSTLGYVNSKGAESRAQSEIAALSAALESYKIDLGAFPSNDVTVLYRELTGRGTVNSNKIYFEPNATITTNLESGPFVDPWGSVYGYSNIGTHFELWSTAGGKDTAEWIRN